jgi:hypothetical protein
MGAGKKMKIFSLVPWGHKRGHDPCGELCARVCQTRRERAGNVLCGDYVDANVGGRMLCFHAREPPGAHTDCFDCVESGCIRGEN